MTQAKRKPRDYSQSAVAVVDFIIEKYDEAPEPAEAEAPESPHVIAGRKGGKARAAALTAAERATAAQKAAQARWQPQQA